MTEALAQKVNPLEVGDSFRFYLGKLQRQGQIIERNGDQLIVRMEEGANQRWECSVEGLRMSTKYRTIAEGPVSLSD